MPVSAWDVWDVWALIFAEKEWVIVVNSSIIPYPRDLITLWAERSLCWEISSSRLAGAPAHDQLKHVRADGTILLFFLSCTAVQLRILVHTEVFALSTKKASGTPGAAIDWPARFNDNIPFGSLVRTMGIVKRTSLIASVVDFTVVSGLDDIHKLGT